MPRNYSPQQTDCDIPILNKIDATRAFKPYRRRISTNSLSLSFAAIFMQFALMSFFAAPSYAQEESDKTSLYIIFDGSNSMWGELPDGSRKIAAAKGAFRKIDSDFFKDREVALRLYGHRRTRDCSDTELAIPFSSSTGIKRQVSRVIDSIKPRGKTLITRSLTAALADFGGRSGDILLISDGIETCDSDPCELAQKWRDTNVDIRIHVVGLGLKAPARKAMQCISDVSETTYQDANNTEELLQTIKQTLEAITAQADENDAAPGRNFTITAVDQNGEAIPAAGILSQPGLDPKPIASNELFTFTGGEYTMSIGVPTAGGELYQPVSRQITIKDSGATKIQVTLQRPPIIRTQFLHNKKEVDGLVVEGVGNGENKFNLQPGADYYLMPGNYEFKAQDNDNNGDSSASTSMGKGDDKTIVFEQVDSEVTVLRVIDNDSGNNLQQQQEFWQNGELVFKVIVDNVTRVQPGTYHLVSNSFSAPRIIDNAADQ